MTELIETHETDIEWTVQFRSELFGVYSVCGPVRRSEATGELTLGLAVVTAAGAKPAREVTGIWQCRAGFLDLTAKDCRAATAHHGTAVLAEFDSYGDILTVIGFVVSQQQNDLVGVGHHLIRSAAGVARNLVSLSEIIDIEPIELPTVQAWADTDALPPDIVRSR